MCPNQRKRNADYEQLEKCRILLLEDDEAIAEMMEEWFKLNGYHCQSERDTPDIIGLVSESRPDVVIIDYLLPEINGGELCSQIKNHAETKHIPVIICSAYAKVLLSLGTYGCDAILSKPLDLTALNQIIDQLTTNACST